MGVTIKVNGTSNSLVHKGSNAFAKCTPPDVCKTPSPGGPVPVPYPVIISRSSDLKNGTKTVKADGGNMIAVKGSEFSRCMGDEAGTAGGVKSSTNMKEAKWISYSPDVKMDGKNACRLSDKMTMNHGNTVCLAGAQLTPVQIKALTEELEKIACECQKDKQPDRSKPSEEQCEKLIDERGKCVTEKLKDKEKDGLWANARFKAPEGLKNPKTGNPVTRIVPDVVLTAAGSYPENTISVGKVKRAFKAGMEAGPVGKVADFKFPCPTSTKAPYPKPKKGEGWDAVDGKGYGVETGGGFKELGPYKNISKPPQDVKVITPKEETCG